jgi:hypothetical protein
MSRERNDPKQTLKQHRESFLSGTARKNRVPAEHREPIEGQNSASEPLRRLDIRKEQEQTEFASNRIDRFATPGEARLVYFTL